MSTGDSSTASGADGAQAPGTDTAAQGGAGAAGTATASRQALSVVAWLWVGLPLLYGLYELIQKATQLFTG